jgi:hypothetical protein
LSSSTVIKFTVVVIPLWPPVIYSLVFGLLEVKHRGIVSLNKHGSVGWSANYIDIMDIVDAEP